MGPIDYSTQVANPFMQALQGYQGGAAIRDDQAQQAQIEQQRQAQVQQQQVLRGLISNPSATAADYSNVGLMFPALAKPLADSWAVRSADQQAADKDRLGQMFAALSSGNPKVAAALATRHAEALKGGTNAESAQQAQTFAQLVEMDPGLAKALVGMKLAAGPGGKELIESIAKLGGEGRAAELQPLEVRAKKAAAVEAEIKAKYGEQSALLDLTKKGWDITAIREDIDIKKQANRIAAMNAATARETNVLKRQELQLQIQAAQQKLDEGVRTKAADVESGRASIDNLLNTADRILAMPDAVRRAAHGTLDSRLPTLQQDVADYEELLTGMGSQTFIAQVGAMKGMGALSNAEGEKLQASLQNLSLRQSPEQSKANIQEVQRLMTKARKNLTTRYGVPETVPDTPAAAPSASEVDALVQRYSGASTVNPPARR